MLLSSFDRQNKPGPAIVGAPLDFLKYAKDNIFKLLLKPKIPPGIRIRLGKHSSPTENKKSFENFLVLSEKDAQNRKKNGKKRSFDRKTHNSLAPYNQKNNEEVTLKARKLFFYREPQKSGENEFFPKFCKSVLR